MARSKTNRFSPHTDEEKPSTLCITAFVSPRLAFLHAIFHPIRPKGRMEKGANFLPFHSGQTGNPAPSQISFPAGFVGKASAEQEL